MKEIQIISCKGNFWYKQKKFPIRTFVNEATVEKNGESYNAFFSANNVEDFYFCDELMGFIAKEDCVDIKTAESHYYTIVKDELYDKGKSIGITTNRVFTSGAQRDSNSNKPFCHNLKGYTRLRFGYHMTKGSNKYGDANWEKGMPNEQYIESMDRHWSQYISGDRSEDHLSAFLFGINGLMDNERKEGVKADSYFKK